MQDGGGALSEREKETLRLLLAGHDAKSLARDLGLSVHTVNERLREARRKLGVTSSREAARLLGEHEKLGPSHRGAPETLGDEDLGVAAAAGLPPGQRSPRPFKSGGRSLAWLGGGTIVMSLLIAAALLLSVPHSQTPAVPAAQGEGTSAAAGAARAWVALLDGQHWAETWQAAGALFKAQMPEARWPSTIQPVRQPLGAASSRTFQNVTKTASLPGAPAGDYEVIQFATDFATKRGAVETVVLAREGSSWKVDGYFIR